MGNIAFRGLRFLVLAAFAAVLSTGCGGGGETSSSGTPGGAAVFDISIATSEVSEVLASYAPVSAQAAVLPADAGFQWAEQITEPDPAIAHVFMDVVRISLLPSGESAGGGDMDGDLNDSSISGAMDTSDPPGFITVVPDSPIRIDLLEAGSGRELGRFLNRFPQAPPGSYDKIRVHYGNVRVELADGSALRFHPTANSRFDIRFRQGRELVIPAGSDTAQADGWVRFFRVDMDVVGLKLRIVQGRNGWNGAKVILRPQIFAEFVSPGLYSVVGTAANVSGIAAPPVSGAFDVSFGEGAGYPRVVSAAFDNDTTWAWSGDVLAGSSRIVSVANATAVDAFRDRAIVEVVGRFAPGQVFRAADVIYSFPDAREGVVDDGWGADDTFVLRTAADNVVHPMPDRSSAYYDDSVAPHNPLTQAAIERGLQIIARGYGLAGGIEAYWISVGGIVTTQ